jgi:hypothetical protein
MATRSADRALHALVAGDTNLPEVGSANSGDTFLESGALSDSKQH